MAQSLLDSLEESLSQQARANALDPAVRAHLERALAHVREASIGIKSPGCCRSVLQLASDYLGFAQGLNLRLN